MLVFGYRFFKSRSGDETAESCVRELSRVSFGDHLLNDGSPVTGRCGPFEPFNSDLTISRRPLGKRHDPTVVYRPSLPAPWRRGKDLASPHPANLS